MLKKTALISAHQSLKRTVCTSTLKIPGLTRLETVKY